MRENRKLTSQLSLYDINNMGLANLAKSLLFWTQFSLCLSLLLATPQALAQVCILFFIFFHLNHVFLGPLIFFLLWKGHRDLHRRQAADRGKGPARVVIFKLPRTGSTWRGPCASIGSTAARPPPTPLASCAPRRRFVDLLNSQPGVYVCEEALSIGEESAKRFSESEKKRYLIQARARSARAAAEALGAPVRAPTPPSPPPTPPPPPLQALSTPRGKIGQGAVDRPAWRVLGLSAGFGLAYTQADLHLPWSSVLARRPARGLRARAPALNPEP